ncbi:hypothetical protein ACTFIN_02795 [Clostridium cagae]|uniref:hypothetical protein n=1 Tax=Clostridium cagae TaxID=2080751 RepID=UPI003F759401
MFPICGAYRLSKFNTIIFDGAFTGVPIIIVGCLMAVFVLINIKIAIPNYIIVILMIIGSYLMISKLKLKKF